jgi:hypothetical protein
VGESLMRAPVPAEALRALRARIQPAGSPTGAGDPGQKF